MIDDNIDADRVYSIAMRQCDYGNERNFSVVRILLFRVTVSCPALKNHYERNSKTNRYSLVKKDKLTRV